MQLRNVFCYICVFCVESNANILWNHFRNALSEDFQSKYDFDTAIQKTLQKIDEILQLHNTCCEQFHLPIDREFLKNLAEIEDSTNVSYVIDAQLLQSNIDSLNEKQTVVFNEIKLCYSFTIETIVNIHFVFSTIMK